MTPTDIQQLAQALHPSLWHTLGICVLLQFGVVVPMAVWGTFLTQKAKNAATKGDIADITRQIEAVRSQYASQLESLKGSYQLRAAALDKRLATHQMAFVQWRRLLTSMGSDGIATVTGECYEWWVRNCVYLSREARDAFVKAVLAAKVHNDRLPHDKMMENWNRIMAASDAIMKGADLPPLPEDVKMEIPERPKVETTP